MIADQGDRCDQGGVFCWWWRVAAQMLVSSHFEKFKCFQEFVVWQIVRLRPLLLSHISSGTNKFRWISSDTRWPHMKSTQMQRKYKPPVYWQSLNCGGRGLCPKICKTGWPTAQRHRHLDRVMLAFKAGWIFLRLNAIDHISQGDWHSPASSSPCHCGRSYTGGEGTSWMQEPQGRRRSPSQSPRHSRRRSQSCRWGCRWGGSRPRWCPPWKDQNKTRN